MSSVDDREIPCPGETHPAIAGTSTRKAVRGQVDEYKDWCEYVDE